MGKRNGNGIVEVSSDPVSEATENHSPIVLTDDMDMSMISVGLEDVASAPIVQVRWKRLFQDRDFNIREESSYDNKALEVLYESVKTSGLLTPLVVAALPDVEDNRFIIVKGNRRYEVMKRIRKEILEFNATCDPDKIKLIRFDRVPCQVLRGVSKQKLEILMLDHETTEGLSTIERFKAVRRLISLGMSETQVIKHLGTTRGVMTVPFRAGIMPEFVGNAYEAYLRDPENAKPKMNNTIVNNLYSVWTDKKVGHNRAVLKGKFDALSETATPPRASNIRAFLNAQMGVISKSKLLKTFVTELIEMKEGNESTAFADSRDEIIRLLVIAKPDDVMNDSEIVANSAE